MQSMLIVFLLTFWHVHCLLASLVFSLLSMFLVSRFFFFSLLFIFAVLCKLIRASEIVSNTAQRVHLFVKKENKKHIEWLILDNSSVFERFHQPHLNIQAQII